LIDRLLSPEAVELYCWQNMPVMTHIHELGNEQYKYFTTDHPRGTNYASIPIHGWSN
jgi:hypothetical protein